ncbi:MAG: SLBB domain-containing protein [Verrucomicrobiota bacterium]|jgi:protein involved in polysaccharide export with SLBB domain
MRLLQHGARQFTWVVCLAATALVMAGCVPPPKGPATEPRPRGTTPLQIGDRIEVDVTGTPLPVEPAIMDISDKGTITLAHINHPIEAAGESPEGLAEIIRTNLVPDYYTHANVTVLPRERYFYVSGEVNPGPTSGRVLYLSRITVTKAIASAGGFTEYAAKHRVKLTRLDGTIYTVDCVKALDAPKLDLEVFPGDKIDVPRRSFIEALTGR